MRHDPADQVGEDPTAGADAARAYRDFWTDVGSTFPDLHGARSTAQYLEDEQWLFQTCGYPIPIRPRSAASRNRVMRGPGVTPGAKRSQGARRPRD